MNENKIKTIIVWILTLICWILTLELSFIIHDHVWGILVFVVSFGLISCVALSVLKSIWRER